MSENEPDLRALLEEATRGPWWVPESNSWEPTLRAKSNVNRRGWRRVGQIADQADAALIAALRNEAAALLDDRDRLLALEAGLRELLVGIENEALGGKRFPATVDTAEVWELLATRPDDAGVTEVDA